MKPPEAKEKAEIDKYLKSIGTWYCSSTTFGFGPSGAPDRVVCLNGRFIGIEVKREGKKPTPIQERRMAALQKAGGLALWGTAKKVIEDFDVMREYWSRLESVGL